MDYIPGGELFSLVDKYGCLPEEVVRIYVAEIALAIGKRVILTIHLKCKKLDVRICYSF